MITAVIRTRCQVLNSPSSVANRQPSESEQRSSVAVEGVPVVVPFTFGIAMVTDGRGTFKPSASCYKSNRIE